MKYIKLFNTIMEYLSYMNGNPFLPNVSLVNGDKKCFYAPKNWVSFKDEYLYFEALEDGMSVSFTKNATSGSLYYSLDKQEWNELTGETPAINSGKKVYFKGDLVPQEWTGSDTLKAGIGTFAINKQCNVAGNVMSLLFADNFIGRTDLTEYDSEFFELFKNCTTIKSAEVLILPATTLTGRCYDSMFSGCTGLITAPELPATTLGNFCYAGMFKDCTELISAPELPATTVAAYCYMSMFDNCKKLIIAPSILPATTLATSCYQQMFWCCTSLTTAPELPATTLAGHCYFYMFDGCSSLTTAPELPATTLTNGCYGNMFNECKKLNYIKMLATDISASDCLSNWVKNVSSTGTFVKAEGVEIPTGYSGIPSGWTVETIDPLSWSTMANGVYAVGADGSPVMKEDADESCTAVALITDNQRIMIVKEDATDGTKTTLYWGYNLNGKDVAGITNTSSSNTAKTDFNGKANTAAIIAAYIEHGVEMKSRDMCKVLQDFNAEEQAAGRTGDWYIPACGQLYEMFQNKAAIEEMLAAIGGTNFLTSDYYWSSSEYGIYDSWAVDFGFGTSYNSKFNYSFVRFVQDLN